MKIEYQTKGVTLDVTDLISIHAYYEAACTAEYILENYPDLTEEQAMKIAYNVRRKMDKYGYSELEAIDDAILEFEEQNL